MPSPSPTRVVKRRRPHNKSKRGCAECKRRHIKCDEGRPQCANCRVSHRSCVYLSSPEETADSPAASSVHSPQTAATPGHVPDVAAAATPHVLDVPCTTTPQATTTTTTAISSSSTPWFAVPLTPSPSQPDWLNPPAFPSTQDDDSAATYTFDDFMLFRHFQTSNAEWTMYPNNAFKPLFDAHLVMSLSTPYLLDQMLSISASHLAHLASKDPAKAEAYRTRASFLQNRALRSFNKILTRRRSQQQQDSDNTSPQRTDAPEYDVVAHFLFASLIGRSVMTERLSSDRHDFNLFLAGLLESMQLLRGSRVVGGSAWNTLLQSPLIGDTLKKIIEPVPEDKEASTKTAAARAGLEVLADMLQQSRLPPTAIDECEKARDGLKYIIDRLPGWGYSILSSWPSVAPPDFMELVQRRVPEALVILAHYAALMHRYRDWWVLGDAGEYILRNVSSYLDSQWHKWLPQLPPDDEYQSLKSCVL